MKPLSRIEELLASLPDDAISSTVRAEITRNMDRAHQEYAHLEQKYTRGVREKSVIHALMQRASDELIEQYRVLFEYSGIPMVILDEDGIITRSNSHFSEFSAVPPPSRDLTIRFLDLIHADDQPRAEAYLHACREGREAPAHLEIRFKTWKDSCPIVSLSAGMLPGGRESVISLHDVTERQRRKAELTAHNERLKALLALYQMTGEPEGEVTAYTIKKATELTTSSMGLLCLVDDENEQVMIEASWSSDLDQQAEPMERHLSRIALPYTDLPRISSVIENKEPLILNEIDIRDQRITHISTIPLLVTRMMIVPVIEDEQVVAVICVANKKAAYENADYLQLSLLSAGMWRLVVRNRQEETLKNVNKKLSLLSTLTRHDVLNLLTALNGYIEISQEMTDNPDLLLFMNKEMNAVHAIEEIIAFTREYELVGVKAPVWQEVSRVFSDAAGSHGSRHVTINGQVQGVWIYADPLLIRVFSNFIDNSFRHGKDIHSISLSYTQKGDDLILIYTDDGTGVDPREKDKIFFRGYGKHTGLGLFLIREIFAITGISIKETGETGKGVRFEMTVPRGNFKLLGVSGGPEQFDTITPVEG
jgi:PAS domain S-box-containing protein